MNRDQFFNFVAQRTPDQSKIVLFARIERALKEENRDLAMRLEAIFHGCFHDEELPEYILEELIKPSPGLFFERVRSAGNFKKGLSVFRERICRFLAEEFLRQREALEGEDVTRRVKAILTNFEKNLRSPLAGPTLSLSGLGFASDELESGTLPALVITGYLIVTLTLRLEEKPKDFVAFEEALEQIVIQLGAQGIGERNLEQAKRLIIKYLQIRFD